MKGVLKAQDTEEREGDLSHREELILEYVPLIRFIAHRMAIRLPSHIEVNDLINAGVIGLMDAMEKFDPAKETQFKTYAEFRIRGAILDELRSRDWVPRSIRRKVNLLADTYARLEQTLGRAAEDEEAARELNLELQEFQALLQQASGVALISLEELSGKKSDAGENGRPSWETIADPNGEDFLAKIHLDEVKRILAHAIDELSPKERMFISLYYYEELTMKEIGKVLKVTESRISQIRLETLSYLRTEINSVLVTTPPLESEELLVSFM